MAEERPLASRCVEVSDAVLGPFLPNADARRLRLRLIADTGDAKLTHVRPYGRHETVDVLDIQPPSAEERAAAIPVTGPVLWGGLFKDHFGHMASEGVHRLWAVRRVAELKDARVAFHASRSYPGQVNPWFAAMLRWFGVRPDRVIFVNRPMRFERLIVPEQGQTLEGWQLFPDYKRLLPTGAKIAAEMPGPDKLYISRRRHIQSGTYLGESFIEDRLVKAGFVAVVPEQEPLRSMLAKIVTAKQIVFAEGSAIHHLDLLRRVKADIFIIGRRAHTTRRFGRVLAAACERWRVFEADGRDLLMDWERDGRQHRARACARTDLAGLMAALSDFFGLDLPAPDPWFEENAALADLARFILATRTAPFQANDEQLGQSLRLLRESPVVKGLLAD